MKVTSKLVLTLALGMLTGCQAPLAKGGLGSKEMTRLKANDMDCSTFPQRLAWVNQQLKARGVYGMNPEDIQSEEDLSFNRSAKIYLWSMRIGCNNPHRYDKS